MPGVARARDIGKQTDSDQVIAILISRKRGTMEMATYGETKNFVRTPAVETESEYDRLHRFFFSPPRNEALERMAAERREREQVAKRDCACCYGRGMA